MPLGAPPGALRTYGVTTPDRLSMLAHSQVAIQDLVRSKREVPAGSVVAAGGSTVMATGGA